jgi:hypothetical protein
MMRARSFCSSLVLVTLGNVDLDLILSVDTGCWCCGDVSIFPVVSLLYWLFIVGCVLDHGFGWLVGGQSSFEGHEQFGSPFS